MNTFRHTVQIWLVSIDDAFYIYHLEAPNYPSDCTFSLREIMHVLTRSTMFVQFANLDVWIHISFPITVILSANKIRLNMIIAMLNTKIVDFCIRSGMSNSWHRETGCGWGLNCVLLFNRPFGIVLLFWPQSCLLIAFCLSHTPLRLLLYWSHILVQLTIYIVGFGLVEMAIYTWTILLKMFNASCWRETMRTQGLSFLHLLLHFLPWNIRINTSYW